MKHQPHIPDRPEPTRRAATPRSPSELLVPTRPPRPPKRLKAEGEPRRMGRFWRFVDGLLSFAFLALVIGSALAIWMRQSFDAPGPLAAEAVMIVPKGDGALETAEKLEQAGIITDRRLFMLQYYVARVQAGGGERSSLKAGEYQFGKSASVRQVMDTIVSGRGILQKITLPEGLTSRQIVERLKAEPGLTGDIAKVPPEGKLLPDTYKFSRGTSRQDILDRMQAEHTKLVAALWPTKAEGLPVTTPEQAIVLASIVEKETGKAEERPRVAAVFVNRMRKGMRLQSDPTIVYGLVGGQGTLGRAISRADIDSRTPYNTYQIDGLPPGAICNPGRASLAAVLNPAVTQDLYFVADGTGGHTFTTTLKDHNLAVQNWRKIERTRAAGAAIDQKAPDAQEAQPPPAAAPATSLINATKAGTEAVPVPRKKTKGSTP